MNIKKMLDYYLKKYRPECTTADDKKGQENKLKPLISKMTNKKSIYKDLPYDLLCMDEQAKLLNFILEKTPERQIVSNMTKTDVDRDYYNFVLIDKDSEKFTREFLNGLGNFELWDINREKNENRVIIQDKSISDETVLIELNNLNERIIRLLIDEFNKFKILGIGFESMSYITEYIDYVSDGILQFLNYRIITVESIDRANVIQGLIEEMSTLSEKIDIQLGKKREEQKRVGNLTAEILTRYFSFYRTHYSRYYEELNIFEILKSEKEQNTTLFCPMQDKYKAEKILVSEDEILNLKELITEGKPVYDYKNKLNDTRRFIDIMGMYGGRSCYPNCPQDIKVYFREIFMSKQGYKGKQPSTIVKDYLSMCDSQGIQLFDKQSQYMFVREKISRGYFREKGLLDLYFLKADFQKVLYDLLLKLYLFYDFEDVIEFIYEVNLYAIRKLQNSI